MKLTEIKYFKDADVDPKNGTAVLNLIMAAPAAVVDSLGAEGAIRCAVEASIGLPSERILQLISKTPKLGVGVPSPSVTPMITPEALAKLPKLKSQKLIKKFKVHPL